LPDEVWAAYSIYWIAMCDIGIGRKEEALKSLESVLAIRKRELGETHPDTINAQSRVRKIKSELVIF